MYLLWTNRSRESSFKKLVGGKPKLSKVPRDRSGDEESEAIARLPALSRLYCL